MAIIGRGSVSLTDLNDAIMSGTAPSNPSVGTLWVDSSGAKNVLKKWNGTAWVAEKLDLENLDPEFTEYISTGVDNALIGLGNLSNDNKVTLLERKTIVQKLQEMLGQVPTGTTALPAVTVVNSYTSGEYYQARKAATDAGLATTDGSYTALATAYTALANYLNGITSSGSYLWDVSETSKNVVHDIVGATFRTNWQNYYNAQLTLQTRTAKRVMDAKTEAESYAKSYRSQLVANGYGDLGTNRNFSAFTYNATEKVTGPGSFVRTTTGEVLTDEFIKVEGNRTYRLVMSMKTSTTSNTHNLGIECFNAAGTSLGKRHIVRNSGGTTVIQSVTSWQRYEGVIGGLNSGAGTVSDSTFPAGTTQVKIWFNLNNGGAANSVYIADVSFALEQIEANKDYNGITMSADKGLVVESTRNTTTMSATKGIEIKRKSDNANIFSVDATTGNLNITGNITMTGGIISWDQVGTPTAQQVGAATPGQVTDAVNAIQVGGRNLLIGSNKFSSNFTASSGNTASLTSEGYIQVVSTAGNSNFVRFELLNGFQDLESKMNEDDEFTVSFEMRSPNHTVAPRFYMKSGMGYYTLTGSMGTNFSTLYTTQRWKKANPLDFHLGFSSVVGTTIIRNIKIEKGNKSTAWSPAPEDVDNSINAIEVGGKNYVERLGGGEYEKTKLYSTDGNFTTTQTDANGKLWMRFTGAAILRINTIKLSPSTTYTWSFYVYTTGTDTQITTQQWHSSGYNSLTHTIGTTPRRIVITFTTPASATDVNEILHIRSLTSADSYFFADFQLERGNKATDWKEAESYTLSKLGTALSDASSAKSSVQDMTSDLKVTPLEKNELKRLWDAIKLEYARINELGVSLDVLQATREAFTNAYNALNSTVPRIEADVLANMNTTYDFVSTTNRDTFRTQMNTYFTRREEMEKAIAEKQKSNTTTVTNKVTSWQSIDTTSIDGSKIYTGSITANQIATNAITASKIKVGAVNLINDPFIENAALGTAGATTALSAAVWSAGWSTDEREIVADTTYGKVLRFRRAGDGTLFTNRFGVDPNKAYRITMTFKHSKTDGTAPTGSLYVGTNMYDADGTTEVPTGGFYNIATKTFASGATNPYFYHPGKGNATHTTWKMLDTYILPAAFYNDRTKLKDASHPAGTGQIMYFNPKTRQIHIRVLVLNSGVYGDNSVTVNELQIASLQVTEVDAGTIVADNIVTGTLNAGLITVTNLNAGSITTGTLDASRITVSNLNAGSLTAGTLNGNMVTVTNLNASNINTGTLSAARINAGSLTADKLSFSNNVNLMVDGYDSFENCILPGVGARSSGMTISLDSRYSLDGLKSLRFEGTSTDNYVYLVNANNSTTYNIQVVPGKTYMVSFYAYATDSTTPVEGWVRRGDTGDHIQFTTPQNTVANQWTRYFGKVTIPTGCTRVSVRVDINVANKPVWFDCFKFEECLTTDSEPGPWATASATVIDGSNIKTGTIDASVVNVTNIDAGNIKTGTLNAVTITGARIDGGSITSSFTDQFNPDVRLRGEYAAKMDGQRFYNYGIKKRLFTINVPSGTATYNWLLSEMKAGTFSVISGDKRKADGTLITSTNSRGLFMSDKAISTNTDASFANWDSEPYSSASFIDFFANESDFDGESLSDGYRVSALGIYSGKEVFMKVRNQSRIDLKSTGININAQTSTGSVEIETNGTVKIRTTSTDTTIAHKLYTHSIESTRGITLGSSFENIDGNIHYNGSNMRLRSGGSFNNVMTDKITWHPITFSGGASGFGTGNSYGIKDDGRVYFEAIVTLPNGLTAGTTIATLVVAARPSKQTYMPIGANNGQTLQFVINTNGTFVLNTTTTSSTNVTIYGSYSLTPNR